MFGIGLLETIETISTSLSDRIFKGLLPVVHVYWGIAVGIYLLWWLTDRGILGGSVSLREVFRLFLGIALVELFLSTSSLYHDYLFEPIRHLGFKLTEVCIRGGSFSESLTSIKDILKVLSHETDEVLKIANSISSAAGWGEFAAHIAWVALYFCTWFMWFLFFAVVVEYQFCFTIFAALSPLAIGLFFFESTRAVAQQILRLPLFGGLVMALSALSMSFVFEVFRFGTEKVPVNEGGELTQAAEKWVFSGEFHQLLLGLLVGSFLLLKAHGIAGKIAQFELSVGANAALASVGAGAKTMMASGAKMTANKLGVISKLNKIREH